MAKCWANGKEVVEAFKAESLVGRVLIDFIVQDTRREGVDLLEINKWRESFRQKGMGFLLTRETCKGGCEKVVLWKEKVAGPGGYRFNRHALASLGLAR